MAKAKSKHVGVRKDAFDASSLGAPNRKSLASGVVSRVLTSACSRVEGGNSALRRPRQESSRVAPLCQEERTRVLQC